MALRTNQNRAIAALLANQTNKEAARAAGVGERTLARWLAEDPQFIAALRAAEDRLIDQAAFRLLSLTDLAINTLADIAKNGRKETSRSLAADRLLTHTLRIVELRTLANRVRQLEDLLL